MGVSGAGKTTVGALLAVALGCEFVEGDLLHPPENIQKMHMGKALTDGDRVVWLHRIAGIIDGWRAKGEACVVSCSALKRSYRDIIIGARPNVALVYLKGSYGLILGRMAARQEHFMPVALLDSQFAILEEPAPDERSIVAGVASAPAAVAAGIVRELEKRKASPAG
jgi:carbohydrate kinase (thermoresistant glucokinase family)